MYIGLVGAIPDTNQKLLACIDLCRVTFPMLTLRSTRRKIELTHGAGHIFQSFNNKGPLNLTHFDINKNHLEVVHEAD